MIPIHPINTGERCAREKSERSTATDQQAQKDAPRILLAEDNEANISTVADYLEANGYTVSVARDGGEAIAKSLSVSPDLILMDIQMPTMSGLEATTRLRSMDLMDTVPIIALTALAMPGDRDRCLEAGACDYLSKPVRLRLLKETIEHFLARGPQDPLRKSA